MIHDLGETIKEDEMLEKLADRIFPEVLSQMVDAKLTYCQAEALLQKYMPARLWSLKITMPNCLLNHVQEEVQQ